MRGPRPPLIANRMQRVGHAVNRIPGVVRNSHAVKFAFEQRKERRLENEAVVVDRLFPMHAAVGDLKLQFFDQDAKPGPARLACHAGIHEISKTASSAEQTRGLQQSMVVG